MQSAPSGTGRIYCRKATLRRGILYTHFSNGACCFSQPAWTRHARYSGVRPDSQGHRRYGHGQHSPQHRTERPHLLRYTRCTFPSISDELADCRWRQGHCARTLRPMDRVYSRLGMCTIDQWGHSYHLRSYNSVSSNSSCPEKLCPDCLFSRIHLWSRNGYTRW